MKKIFLLLVPGVLALKSYSQCGVQTTSTDASCNGVCNGSATATANGNPPFTYSWAPGGQTTQTITGLCAGTYTITITDGNNCTASAVVTINQPPALFLNTGQSNVVCANTCTGVATVTASGGISPYMYFWTPSSQTTATATGLCAGSYTLIVTDGNGCTASAFVNIIQPTPLIVTTSSTTESCTNCCDATATVNPSGGTAPYIFSWSTTPSQSGQTATGLCAGTYTVCVTDANGCTNCDTITINPISGIQNISREDQMSIYPNPTNDIFYFETGRAETIEFVIYDLLGKKVGNGILPLAVRSYEAVDVCSLKPGIYFITVYLPGRTETLRLIKY